MTLAELNMQCTMKHIFAYNSVSHSMFVQYAEISMLELILKIVHSRVHTQTDDESVLRIQCRLTLLTGYSDPVL